MMEVNSRPVVDFRPGIVITHFLGWKGRISRREWWMCYAFDTALALVFFSMSGSALFRALGPIEPKTLTGTFLLWASTCANIKRFHDRNKPWFWALIAFVPAFGTIWVIVELGFFPGTKGSNNYGDDPLVAARKPPPPLPIQMQEARASLQQLYHIALAVKTNAAGKHAPQVQSHAGLQPRKSVPTHTLQQPLIQYGYKRPDRTVTRGY